MRCVVVCAVAVTGAGCFSVPPDVAYDAAPDGRPDARPIDSLPPDATLSCAPSSIVCDDATSEYTECSTNGTVQLQMHCPLGSTDATKCVDVNPSNGLAAYLDQAHSDTAAINVALSGNSTIDTETGVIVTGAAQVQAPTAVVNGVRVFMFKSLSISGTVKVTGANGGSKSLALIVDGDVSIQGLLDVSADGSTPGPGGYTWADTPACSGGGSIYVTDTTSKPGAGGAGHAVAGAHGGNSGDGDTGLVAGTAAVDADISPLVGGCPGGTISASPFNAVGGGGGGAVQIVSRTTIAVINSGKIDASGGGGACMGGPGGGGGAGRSILLEAPQVTVNGASVVLSTRGGGGGGTNSSAAGAQGHDGSTGATPAAGGSGGGGAGGTETTGPGTGSSTSTNGGGGGGAVGETRFNTRDGTISISGAAIYSAQSSAVISTREVP